MKFHLIQTTGNHEQHVQAVQTWLDSFKDHHTLNIHQQAHALMQQSDGTQIRETTFVFTTTALTLSDRLRQEYGLASPHSK